MKKGNFDNSNFNGWISLHRPLLKWLWFRDSQMVHLFIYMLLRANSKDGNYKGVEIKRGQFITGIATISRDTNLSTRSIRTGITRLKSTGEILTQSTSQYTIITLCKYEVYQNKNNQIDKPIDKRNDRQATTNNNIDKKNKYISDQDELIFEKAWEDYHRLTGKPKTDKEPARKAWRRLTSSEKDKAVKMIAKYAVTNAPEFLKKFRTYLTDKTFNDELVTFSKPKNRFSEVAKPTQLDF